VELLEIVAHLEVIMEELKAVEEGINGTGLKIEFDQLTNAHQTVANVTNSIRRLKGLPTTHYGLYKPSEWKDRGIEPLDNAPCCRWEDNPLAKE